MLRYVADFETSKNDSFTETWVWAWGLCEVGNVEDTFQYGGDIDSFMAWCEKGKGKEVYFHNLKFDGEFIIAWLLRNGFKWSQGKEEKTFNTIISDMGAWYQIEIVYKRWKKKIKKVTIKDSLKKINFPVAKIAKDYGLPFGKGDIDHNIQRMPNHAITAAELDYLKRDVQIVAIALGLQFDQGLIKMTTGSDALHNFKQALGGNKMFEYHFPILPVEIDASIRAAYRGGFTFLSEAFASKDVKGGIVYDVNSLYPSIMYSKLLPYDMPVYFKGQYQPDEQYPLYIQSLRCEFELKKDHIPTIQLKGSGRFIDTEYIKDSDGEPVDLILTNVDLQLFFDHYDVYVHEWYDGYKFKGCVGVFKDYIDYWMKIKETTTGAPRAMAKLMLNSLYGKFATNPKQDMKEPYLENGIVKYRKLEQDPRDPIYTAMGVFITSYSRELTIRTAQSVFPRFIYADTDSIHLEGTEPPEIDIHATKLGAWKYEGTFTRARFIRAKSYIEEIDGTLHVTCAGMPDTVKKKVTWDNFRRGFKEDGKLRPKKVAGGVILENSTFTLS
jgi:hypothetical protein